MRMARYGAASTASALLSDRELAENAPASAARKEPAGVADHSHPPPEASTQPPVIISGHGTSGVGQAH